MDIYNGWANFAFMVKWFVIGFPIVYGALICSIAAYRTWRNSREN